MNDKLNNTICDKEHCSGCMACRQICPYNAIEIEIGNDGFEYPVRTEKCINCGLCTRICPSLNILKPKKTFTQKVYACYYNDENVIMKSSSGGIFTAIVQAYCDENYAIFGAEFDNDFTVFHSYVTDKTKIDKYRKSKYAQSSIGNSYIDVKMLLESEKKVLFTGTPCQIAGLKAFLNKEYDNLLTIDVICHGTPSSKVLRKYMQYMEQKHKSKIKEINFREKTIEHGKWNSKCMRLLFENKKCLVENVDKNLYLKGYQAELYYRQSCYNCKYANPIRNSDITISDCWGIEKVNPKLDMNHGVSMIVINSEKGEKIFNIFKELCNCLPLDLDFAIRENSKFREPAKENGKRKFFYSNIDNVRFDKLIFKCIPQKRLRHLVGKLIPNKIKKVLR